MNANGDPGDCTGEGEIGRPATDGIRAALKRVLLSQPFANSQRRRKFLSYIVEESLAGRADGIKAAKLATEVFGRNAGFDAQNDPVVRIEAGRLRQALDQYYRTDGRDDPILISVPKGHYVPVFEARPTPKPAPEAVSEARRVPRPWIAGLLALPVLAAGLYLAIEGVGTDRAMPEQPRIVVVPFADFGEHGRAGVYAASLSDELISALSRFRELEILGAHANPHTQEQPPDYIVEGSVKSRPNGIVVASRLLGPGGTVLWSEVFDRNLVPGDLFLVPSEVAAEVATIVAQPYGVVFSAEATARSAGPPNDLDAYFCTLQFYRYRSDVSAAGHAAVRECLDSAVRQYPEYATAQAMLSLVDLDEARFGFNRKPGEPPAIERALAGARNAVRLDPRNVRAQQALMAALFFDNQIEEALAVGERARELNPNDTELLSQYGQFVAWSGRWKEGGRLIERALALNPDHAALHRSVLAFIEYMKGNFDRARREIEAADQTRLPLHNAIAALIYAELGMTDKASLSLAAFERDAPDFIPNIWFELSMRHIIPRDQLRIAQSLEKAGAVVPAPPPGYGF